MKMPALVPALLLGVSLCVPSASWAQLSPPNDMGVAFGHVHLAVKDVASAKTFFTTMLGGKAISNGPIALIEFPGIYVMLRQADAPGAPAGTTVDHFGLVYKDIAAARARWTAGGVKFDIGEVNKSQGYVFVPNSDIRVEVFGDESLPGEVSMDHFHLFTAEADMLPMQAWYAKVFGGFAGQRQRVARPGIIEVNYFGRFNMSFGGGMRKPEGTKGHGVAHIGFEVRDIEAFAKRLEGMGLKFEAPIRLVQGAPTKVGFFTDPCGTYIEVTEKLAPQH